MVDSKISQRVLIVGGTGVFGSRLARLLIEDGHDVLIASRTRSSAATLCAEIGGQPVTLDRNGPLTDLPEMRPDIVIDAAGPFQAYGHDPYRLVRAVLEAGAHYMDLSDDAAFCDGISALDDLARQKARTALSGVSSVPALSSAVVADLVDGLHEVTLIESAIMPGNRAPRGRSVMRAILTQVGAPLRLWRGGQWVSVPGWSGTRRFALPGGMMRPAAFIGAPDLRLFTSRFAARSILFRAGLELPVMHRGLRMLGVLRRVRLCPNPATLTGPLLWVANRLERFGTDKGGMRVDVCGRTADGTPLRKTWSLRVADGDGPFIPAIPAALLVNRMAHTAPQPGARACIAEFTRIEAEAALSLLDIRFHTDAQPDPPLFEAALGDRWSDMPAAWRAVHDLWDWQQVSGRGTVASGSHPIARLIAALFRFPKAGADIPVTVTMQRHGRSEVWVRDFGGRRFRSQLTPAGPGCVSERFGAFRFELDLPTESGTLKMPVQRGWCLGVPLPRFLLPGSETSEEVRDGVFQFDVRLSLPMVGLLVHYHGWLTPARA